MKIRALLLAAMAAATLCVPAAARPAQTPSAAISGYEYYATSTDGRFVGTASGALQGVWHADVRHAALCLSCTPSAAITGGTFSLPTVLHGVPTLVTGSFTGGTVQVIDKGADCTNQTFAVDGVLGNVGTWYTGNGRGTFGVTLTHHRRSIFGTCVTYAASVAGSLAVSF